MQSQLHQIIAVIKSLATVANNAIQEGIVTFSKKQEHFNGYEKTLKMHDDLRSHEEAAGTEIVELTTTVGDKLRYIQDPVANYYDAILQQELTNQGAKADFVVDGRCIFAGVPAIALLNMETKLAELRKLFEAIPTQKPGINWVSSNQGPEIFKAEHPECTNKTEASCQVVILAAATEKHPAQVKTYDVQKPVGTYTKISYTGTISPAEKSRMLGNIDKLMLACKKSRMEANCTPASNGTWGKEIFDFILNK